MNVAGVLLGLVPVSLFLAALLYLDSYKLVRLRLILILIGAGALTAGLSYLVNTATLQADLFDRSTITRYTAPFVEELLKALPLVFLLVRKRIGFLVDAAICGFAVGCGFALLENLYYLWAVTDATPMLWLIRGVGTAIMHGGTTAIFAIVAKTIAERDGTTSSFAIPAGIAIAFVIHSAFNHFILPPIYAAMVVVLTLPPLMIIVFDRSERYLESWLGSGFDLDVALLRAIRSGEFSASRVGQYLQSLREHFDGAVVADMLCYLRLNAELALRAKGILMLRENGLEIPRDPDIDAKLDELRYLRKSIGKTGELAMAPVVHKSPIDLWQLNLLEN